MKRALILGGTGAMGGYLVDIMSAWKNWILVVTSRSVHESLENNVKYVCGNARDDVFLNNLLKEHWDAIVDFMNWGYQEYVDSHMHLLLSTDHYIFLSSSRVYANSDQPLTELSDRLLDITTDEAFLKTQRYALRKARQENMLFESVKKNFTIIRPYISYSPERLQLGVYEKEQWLFRVLAGKDIIIRKEILKRKTCMTHSLDVSQVIANIIGKKDTLGQVIQIASSETMAWEEILKIYLEVIITNTDYKPRVFTFTDIPEVDEFFEGGYQIKYDRLWDRSFDSKRIDKILGKPIEYVPMKKGLRMCLLHFLNNSKFKSIDNNFEALVDELIVNNKVQIANI